MTDMVNRDRPAKNPGGMQCNRCDEIFIGEEWHLLCAVCDKDQIALEAATEIVAIPETWPAPRRKAAIQVAVRSAIDRACGQEIRS